MDERQRAFSVLVSLLQRVMGQRGEDPATVTQQYVWPGAAPHVPAPVAAISLAPLLTGGGHPTAVAPTPGGVVPVPMGLVPPTKQ